MQMRNWFIRFPTILQACECIIEMLRGQYAHAVGSYNEAAFHFVEAAKVCLTNSLCNRMIFTRWLLHYLKHGVISSAGCTYAPKVPGA